MESALEIPITWLLFATMLAFIGWMLLGDYRRVVLPTFRVATSIKIFLYSSLRPTVTTEYLGILLIVLAAWFFIAGLLGIGAWVAVALTGLVNIQLH